jgi:hypothetical protein
LARRAEPITRRLKMSRANLQLLARYNCECQSQRDPG